MFEIGRIILFIAKYSWWTWFYCILLTIPHEHCSILYCQPFIMNIVLFYITNYFSWTLFYFILPTIPREHCFILYCQPFLVNIVLFYIANHSSWTLFYFILPTIHHEHCSILHYQLFLMNIVLFYIANYSWSIWFKHKSQVDMVLLYIVNSSDEHVSIIFCFFPVYFRGMVDVVKGGCGSMKDGVVYCLSCLSPSNIKQKWSLMQTMTWKQLMQAFFTTNLNLALTLITFLFTFLW